MLLRTHYNNNENTSAQKRVWENNIGWGIIDEKDGIVLTINEAIKSIEQTCRPFLSEHKSK